MIVKRLVPLNTYSPQKYICVLKEGMKKKGKHTSNTVYKTLILGDTTFQVECRRAVCDTQFFNNYEVVECFQNNSRSE